MARLVNEVYRDAISVLRENATPHGIKASRMYYNQVWARDAFISLLGANMLEDEPLLSAARTTIDVFSKTASPLGQIANHFDLGRNQADYGWSGATDASTWYIIGLASLFHATEDSSLLGAPLDAAMEAYRWLRYQDSNNLILIDSPEGADWMDAAVQRTGKTLYNNVLFLMASRCIESLCSAASKELEPRFSLERGALEDRFREMFLPSKETLDATARYSRRYADLYRRARPLGLSRKYFLHYLSFYRVDARFDTLSNLLCLLSGVSPQKTSSSILGTIAHEKLASPYPIRTLDVPYRKGEAGYDPNFDLWIPVQHRNLPYRYQNGGVWPFVGGFYVCALYHQGSGAAASELGMLARANTIKREGDPVGFNEWLDGKTGKPGGQCGQSWNAGMYIAAYEASKGRNPFGFVS